MPLYAYKCPRCQWGRDDMRKVEERNDGPDCGKCGVKMALKIVPVPGIVKNPAVPRSK